MNDRNLVSITEQVGDPVSNEERMRLYDRYAWVRSLVAGQDIFEVACGSGLGVAYLSSTARSVRGSDLSSSNIELGKTLYGDELPIEVGSADSIPVPDESLDSILILEALYFLPDPMSFLREAYRALRPGGSLLITVNNKSSLNFSPNWMGRTYFDVASLSAILKEARLDPTLLGGCRIEEQKQSRGLLLMAKKLLQGIGLTPKNKHVRQVLKRVMYGPSTPLGKEIPSQHPVPELYPLDSTREYREFKILYANAIKPID